MTSQTSSPLFLTLPGGRIGGGLVPTSGRVVDLLITLVDLFLEVVMLLLEQGTLRMDEVSYFIHLSNTGKYVVHLFL